MNVQVCGTLRKRVWRDIVFRLQTLKLQNSVEPATEVTSQTRHCIEPCAERGADKQTAPSLARVFTVSFDDEKCMSHVERYLYYFLTKYMKCLSWS